MLYAHSVVVMRPYRYAIEIIVTRELGVIGFVCVTCIPNLFSLSSTKKKMIYSITSNQYMQYLWDEGDALYWRYIAPSQRSEGIFTESF